ncbi:MAG: PDZ domain-containing protein [Mycobacterium sp.]|nr:PDZ domain-containing protein [Mycobacterium sp.]
MDSTYPRPRAKRGRRFCGVLSVLTVFVAVAVAPATADPVAPVPALPLDQSALLSRVVPGLVDIDTTLGYQGAAGAGTGIVISPNGDVLTNNHVIEGSTDIRVISLANSQSYQVDVLGFDRANDIAVIRLRGANNLPTAALGSSATVRVGDPIAAVGNSNGTGGPPSYAPGTVTQLGASVRATNEAGGDSRELFDLIRVAAEIRPGDSGGPLVNNAGQVVGVTVAATLEFRMGGVSGGEGFAIPIDRAMAIANQIRSGAPAPGVHLGDSAFIGVAIADALALGGPRGAVVRQVLPGTPAGIAGLQGGDVITAVDGIPVNSAADLSNLMDQRRPGNTIMLTWIDRFGNPRTVPVLLAKGPVG